MGSGGEIYLGEALGNKKPSVKESYQVAVQYWWALNKRCTFVWCTDTTTVVAIDSFAMSLFGHAPNEPVPEYHGY
jgi:hypothetical protein